MSVTLTLCVFHCVRSNACGCRIGDVHSTNTKFNRWCQCWMARIFTHLQVCWGRFCVRHLVHDNHFIRNSNPIVFMLISTAELFFLLLFFFILYSFQYFQCHLYCSFVFCSFCQCRSLSTRFSVSLSLWRVKNEQRTTKKEWLTRWKHKYTGKCWSNQAIPHCTVQYIITKHLYT